MSFLVVFFGYHFFSELRFGPYFGNLFGDLIEVVDVCHCSLLTVRVNNINNKVSGPHHDSRRGEGQRLRSIRGENLHQ